MTSPRLLVVDDNRPLLEAMMRMIRSRIPEATVDGCATAPEALARIATTDYDAILSDIRMPGMDGLELLARVRALRPETPTLLVTGDRRHDLATLALRGGAYDLVEKPIDWDYLVASLHRAIRMRELTREVDRQRQDLTRLAQVSIKARDQAVAEAAAARWRLEFLVDASTRLAASLEYEATVEVVASLAVPALADWCVVDVAEPDRRVRRTAARHADPAWQSLVEEIRRYAPEPGGVHPVGRALASGELVLLSAVGEAERRLLARSPEHGRLLDALGVRSFMCVPLVVRGQTIGALSLVSSAEGRGYGPADLALAAELARRAAQALENARLYQEAQQAVRMRDDFLARASHELRTPLTSALGTVRLLRKAKAGLVRESPEALIDIAGRNLAAMAVLIDHLLDASKLASGRDTLALERIDLPAAVERAAEVVGAQAREKGVALRVRVPRGLLLRADAVKIEQLFVNLLANAIKFTPAGGEVDVEAGAGADSVEVRVRDTGEGIPREHLERIFQPFFQAGDATRHAGDRRARRTRGTGLGLAICRQIVDLHGGRIWAESEGPGRGSTFVVRLASEGVALPGEVEPKPRRSA